MSDHLCVKYFIGIGWLHYHRNMGDMISMDTKKQRGSSIPWGDWFDSATSQMDLEGSLTVANGMDYMALLRSFFVNQLMV